MQRFTEPETAVKLHLALENSNYKLYVKIGHRDNYLSEPEFPLRLRLRMPTKNVHMEKLQNKENIKTSKLQTTSKSQDVQHKTNK